MKKFLLLTTSIFLFSLVHSFAQKKVLIEDKDQIIEYCKKDLDASMASGVLKEWATENKIKGEFIVDITIQDKGKVLGIYMVSNDNDDIKMQNRVKDRIRLIEFALKTPKGKSYKFQYSFQFN